MRGSTRRILIVVGIAIAAFAAASVYADVQELGSRLANFQWWAFGAALGLALVNYALRLARWMYYLRDRQIEVPRKTSILVFLSGFALSITPGKVGELIKSYLLRESHGIEVSRSAPIVIAERLTDLVALLMLGCLGFILHGVGGPTILAGTAIAGSLLAVLAWPRGANACIRLMTLPRPTRRFRDRLIDFYARLAELVRPKPFIIANGLSVVAWLAECVGFAIIIAGFTGAQPEIGLAMLIYAVTTVAGALSFLPGGLLVTEAAMTVLLVQTSQGLDEPTAVAATILTRLATLWFAVLIGVAATIWLRRTTPEMSL